MTNFQYLTELNKMAGRSFNDLMQYPVFPFVLADFGHEVLDLNDLKTFRYHLFIILFRFFATPSHWSCSFEIKPFLVGLVYQLFPSAPKWLNPLSILRAFFNCPSLVLVANDYSQKLLRFQSKTFGKLQSVQSFPLFWLQLLITKELGHRLILVSAFISSFYRDLSRPIAVQNQSKDRKYREKFKVSGFQKQTRKLNANAELTGRKKKRKKPRFRFSSVTRNCFFSSFQTPPMHIRPQLIIHPCSPYQWIFVWLASGYKKSMSGYPRRIPWLLHITTDAITPTAELCCIFLSACPHLPRSSYIIKASCMFCTTYTWTCSFLWGTHLLMDWNDSSSNRSQLRYPRSNLPFHGNNLASFVLWICYRC